MSSFKTSHFCPINFHRLSCLIFCTLIWNQLRTEVTMKTSQGYDSVGSFHRDSYGWLSGRMLSSKTVGSSCWTLGTLGTHWYNSVPSDVCCSTRVNQPVVWLRAGRLSPLCRWIQSGRRQSFGAWSRDTAQHFQCSPDTPRSCLAVRLRSAWRYLCPCCAVSWAVLWDRTVDFPCRSAAVT